MAIEGTKALKTVRNEAQAQELLNEGWLLLGLFDRQDAQRAVLDAADETVVTYPILPKVP